MGERRVKAESGFDVEVLPFGVSIVVLDGILSVVFLGDNSKMKLGTGGLCICVLRFLSGGQSGQYEVRYHTSSQTVGR